VAPSEHHLRALEPASHRFRCDRIDLAGLMPIRDRGVARVVLHGDVVELAWESLATDQTTERAMAAEFTTELDTGKSRREIVRMRERVAVNQGTFPMLRGMVRPLRWGRGMRPRAKSIRYQPAARWPESQCFGGPVLPAHEQR
jgi:hypothetical protein